MSRSIVLTIAVLLSSLAYFALAVLGEGGLGALFSHPALVAVAVVFVALAVAAVFTRGNLSSGVREDRGNRWVIAALGVIGLLTGWLPPYTDRLDF